MSRRVLVADDDQLFCKLLQYTLEQAGVDWMVDTVSTGRQAVEAIDQTAPDLLILDLKMPDGDGFVVLEERRSRQQDFPVIVVSHLLDDDRRQRCEDLGALQCMHKMQLRMPDLLVMMQRTLSVA